MRNINNNQFENEFKMLMESVIDSEQDDDIDLTDKESAEFIDEFKSFIGEFIEENSIEEEFTSYKNSGNHFKSHCLGKYAKYRTSKRTNVYYDFKTLTEYINYENKVNSAISTPDIEISRLEVDKIFDGIMAAINGKIVKFTKDCGFRNAVGPIEFVITPKVENVTSNYNGDTIDFLVKSIDGKTISLYPIDKDYFFNKFTNIADKYL